MQWAETVGKTKDGWMKRKKDEEKKAGKGEAKFYYASQRF